MGYATLSRLAALMILSLLLAGCLGGGSPSPPSPAPDPDPPSDGTGTIVLTLSRAGIEAAGGVMTQSISDEATHLRVRLYRPGRQTLKDFELPAPGETKAVEITVQAGAGYTLDVLTYKRWQEGGSWLSSDTAGLILDAGRAEGINITPNDTSTVSLSLDPYSYSFSGPGEVDGGESYTIGLTVDGGPNVFSQWDRFAKVNDTPWTDERVAWSAGVDSAQLTVHNDTEVSLQREETAPDVDSDTTLYYGFQLWVAEAYYDEDEDMPRIALTAPSLTRGQDLREVLVSVGDGSVIIDF